METWHQVKEKILIIKIKIKISLIELTRYLRSLSNRLNIKQFSQSENITVKWLINIVILVATPVSKQYVYKECMERKKYLFTFWIFHIFPSLTMCTVSPFTVTTIKKRHFFDTGRGGCPRWAAEERPEDFTRTVKWADFYELIVDNGRLCLDFFFFFHLGFLSRHIGRLHPSFARRKTTCHTCTLLLLLLLFFFLGNVRRFRVG